MSKPSACWASRGRVEPSTAWQKMKTKSTKRTMTTKMKGGRRGVEVRRGKNPRQGESLDKGQDRQYTTNKQDPQDMPAGRWICRGGTWHAGGMCVEQRWARLSNVEQCWALAFFCLVSERFLIARRIRQRLHKKLGSVFSKKDFALAMERFKLLEQLGPAWPRLASVANPTWSRPKLEYLWTFYYIHL